VPAVPLVSVLLAVADGERFVRAAVDSVLRQTVSDLELVVVDDGSVDATPAILEGVDDPRLRVLRNETRAGLAMSLNRALDEARGTYVARMDADDAALPGWLERTLALIRERDDVGFVGAGVLDVDERGRPRGVHLHEPGRAAMRWRALFSAPVFHDTVLVERDVLERNALRYDPSFGESEDYDLWTRLLDVTEGGSVEAPLVLHRLHPGQASRRRGELQRSLAEEVSRREIARLTPELTAERAALARQVALGAAVAAAEVGDAAKAFTTLLDRFSTVHPYPDDEHGLVRQSAARALVRLARRAPGAVGARVLRDAARIDPALPAHVVARRRRRRRLDRRARSEAGVLLASVAAEPDRPTRVVAVFPEPTPYRAPLLDRVGEHPQLDLQVIYAAETVAGRTWRVEPRHPAIYLEGLRVPGADRVLHHDYPVTPRIGRALADADPEVVVVSGWSTFAAQAALAWCRVRGVPYVLLVESHDEGPRPGWRRRVKGSVVPPIVRGAAGVLITGTLARRSMIARGARPERVRVFANTIDVEAFGDAAARLVGRRDELRSALGAGPDDVVVLSVGRLAREKRLDTLVEAVADAGDSRLLLALVGDGPERESLERLAAARGVRLVLAGDVEWERIAESYVAADVFALLSERETWAVVVNEAASCGLPLVLCDRVGAAHDLLRDGENGMLVAVGDVAAVAEALGRLAADPALRAEYGRRSRELARDWGYGPSVDGFVAAVQEAVSDTVSGANRG
jgi:glycosyltransferase involved in cell wall biosynthesis/GT2 family glycosyltransferase